jgi:hypothetical protein
MICESLNSSGGLEGGPKYVMYLSLGIENHPGPTFFCFLDGVVGIVFKIFFTRKQIKIIFFKNIF